MEDLLQQIEKALDYNLYYIALQSTLSLPDICASLASTVPSSDRMVAKEYKDWFDKNFIDKCSISASDCYFFRCANIHEAKTVHKKLNYSRIIFLEPKKTNIIMHNCIINDAFCIDVNIFCRDMIKSVRKWLSSVQNTEPFESHYKTFIKRHPTGLFPYIDGIPVIS